MCTHLIPDHLGAVHVVEGRQCLSVVRGFRAHVGNDVRFGVAAQRVLCIYGTV